MDLTINKTASVDAVGESGVPFGTPSPCADKWKDVRCVGPSVDRPKTVPPEGGVFLLFLG